MFLICLVFVPDGKSIGKGGDLIDKEKIDFQTVTGQSLTIQDKRIYEIICFHPLNNNYCYYGYFMAWSGAIVNFTVVNTASDLPYITAGTTVTFKSGWWTCNIRYLYKFA